MLTSFTSCATVYDTCVNTVAERQGTPKDSSLSEDKSCEAMEVESETADAMRKFKSRQGETLSRWTSVVYWNGDALAFSKSLPVLLPAIVASLDEESDQDRVSHARLALSLAAQSSFDESVVVEVIKTCDMISQSPRYRIRGALLPFLQVMSFSLLFTASNESLNLIRRIVTGLLSDTQLEVREAAAATFVPLIRDTRGDAIAVIREKFVSALRETCVRARRGQRIVMSPEQVCKRHGAILGLGSMISASPYDVPDWMPSVLVTLTGCINDPAPLSTTTRRIFGDFMRTHRDEWQVHKQAFSTDELECVSEQLVSPSYYA
jgi:proteasome activator subunit 4